ncbi:PHD finger protein ALFIN-LIKE 1-like, partial [Olea europaea var. sylvestris]|uniref:PHD finger protein ALFIN-LIKE 1-like n=1 Tax=Olea europaea var. sylvestris TaxID=158386 RepID=UPI000C1D83FE
AFSDKEPHLWPVIYYEDLSEYIYIYISFCSFRKRLFSLINDLPTVFEVVTERKPVKDKATADSGSRSRVNKKRSSDGQTKSNPKLADESYEEEDDEHSETLCGSCGGNYDADEFWIGCDICEQWFHGKCVKITPAKAENIKQYKCPSCMKRNRQ